MAAQTKTPVVKAVMCRVTGEPIAIVKVPANVRTIKLAGAYTIDGDACNVSVNKVSSNKRAIKKIDRCWEFRMAVYHEKSGTYYL